MKVVKVVKARRILTVVAAFLMVILWLVTNPESYEAVFTRVENTGASDGIYSATDGSSDESGASAPLVTEVLEKLEVKGRAPKTGYKRTEFYDDWPSVEGCSLRQKILKREMGETAVLDGCNVVAGEFDEPYTGEHLKFTVKEEISRGVQIDHVVALSDAWQKGAQELGAEERYALATDPLNLLAVDATANGQKSDGDAATWLPPNKKFRCQYVARQVSVKYRYGLWVTSAEKDAILRVLSECPNERAVGMQES